MSAPLLIALAGLPGTGKSTLAARLAAVLPGTVLDKDRVRAAVFPPEEVEYSNEQDDLVCEMLYQATGFLLAKGRTVILDGRTYLQAGQVERLARFARECPARLVMVMCTCPPEVAQSRLERDAVEGGHLAGNRDFELYRRLEAAAEAVPYPHLVVDTSRSLEACTAACVEYIRSSAISGEAK